VAYATPNDIIARYPNRDLVQLTNEDPTATTVNEAVLQQALEDASAEIDGYIGSRFAMPLADPSAMLNRLACDIAIYRMQTLRPLHDLEDARNRYEDAVSLLVRVATGAVTLGLAADGTEPAPARDEAVVEYGGDSSGALPSRIFSRGSLKGY
jgi:phage gp36-like protein